MDTTGPGKTVLVHAAAGGVGLAAVDVGILNLTNYKPPAPDDYYLGQRRLTAEIRDLYGQLIDGMQGTRGQIRTGGDSAGAELQGSPPTQKPLALYSGIVTVGADGSAEVSFDVPEFAGTARVMAVAWSKDKVGRAAGDVTIRDPVVLTVTEFLILQSLAHRPGVVKSRNALMDAAYDDQVYVDDRTIDSHIKRLRKKFKVVDEEFEMIETLYGVGYRFKE